MFFLHLSSSLYGVVSWASPMFITGLDVIPHRKDCGQFDKEMIKLHLSQGLTGLGTDLSFNESFKASIITQKISTLGYRVMPPFC